MKYYVLIIFFWLIHINVYALISHSITFDSNKLKLKDRILEGGSVYIELEYEDCLISDNVDNLQYHINICILLYPMNLLVFQ